MLPPSNGSPSRRPDERDDRVVPVLRAAVLDRREGRVLVAQLLDDLVDPGVVDGLDAPGRTGSSRSRRASTSGPDRDGRLEDERLALLGLDDLHVGVGQGQDVLLDERLAIGVLHQVVDRLVEDDARAEVALEDRSRRLAGPEAGDAGPAGEGADGRVKGRVQALGGDLDLEQDGRLGGGGPGDLHRPRSIGRVGPGSRSGPGSTGRW